jgi:hypothetical protein
VEVAGIDYETRYRRYWQASDTWVLNVGFALSWLLDGYFCLAVGLAGGADRRRKVFLMHTCYALLIYTVKLLAILAPLTPSKEAAVLAGVHIGLYTASLAITAPRGNHTLPESTLLP